MAALVQPQAGPPVRPRAEPLVQPQVGPLVQPQVGPRERRRGELPAVRRATFLLFSVSLFQDSQLLFELTERIFWSGLG